MLLLTLLLAAAPTSQPSQFHWQVDRFANEFWILDNASAWDGDTSNAFRQAFERQAPLDANTSSALQSYAAIRRAHSSENEPDPTPATVSLLPPRIQTQERFAVAFLNSRDERAAASLLKLSPQETEALVRDFAILKPQLDALIGPLDALQREDAALETAADKSHMSEFVERMKHFYGVNDRAPWIVHVLWAPPHYGKATVWDHDVILPLDPAVLAKPTELESWLGVVVHELGHALLAQLGPKQSFDVTERILAAGTINQRHNNIIDEATQAAIGNIVFLRDRLPEALDRFNIYSSDSFLEYPDAIDTLARALEPLVSTALAAGEPFQGAFLDRAVATQKALFGDAPAHYAHVAMVLSGSRRMLTQFNGQFWGNDRFSFGLSDLNDFDAASKSAPRLSRWIVLTQAEATPEVMSKLHLTTDVKLAAGQGACVRAAPRVAQGGYDFLVLGRDTDSLRRVLIAVHRASVVPEKTPLCVSE